MSKIRGLFLLLLVLFITGCPASPPSGPAEIPGPVFLRFPRSLTIDVQTISSQEGSALELFQKGFIGTFGEFSDEIAFGADLALGVNSLANGIISERGLLGGVFVTVNPLITHFTTAVLGESLEGEELKIDFSRFSSPKTETLSCSGSTAGDLICYRIWVGGRRLMAGFFTQLPTEGQDGAGHLWLKLLEEFIGDVENPPDLENFQIGISWDHSNPADKVTEMFIDGNVEETVVLDGGHILSRQEGEDEATAVKTLKETTNISSEESSGEVYYLGRWQEGGDFWSGKFDFIFGSSGKSNPGVCARISTGDEVDGSQCASIETAGEEFLEFADKEDFTFPSDFPSSPTF